MHKDDLNSLPCNVIPRRAFAARNLWRYRKDSCSERLILLIEKINLMKWFGPLTIDELLDGCFENSSRIPESQSVYLISRVSWKVQPYSDCEPLYVGSNTGASDRFRTRIGDLIADMFGFFGSETGHHSGGKSLHEYCRKWKLNPKNLYIGWLDDCQCVRCAENAIYDDLKPLLNKVRPSKCGKHCTRPL